MCQLAPVHLRKRAGIGITLWACSFLLQGAFAQVPASHWDQSKPSQPHARLFAPANAADYTDFEILRLPDISEQYAVEDLEPGDLSPELFGPEMEAEPVRPVRKNNSFGGDRAPVKSQAWWMPTSGLSGQPGELTISGVDLGFAFPLRIEENGIWLGRAGIERLEVQSAALLPDSGLPIPEEFWNIQFGVMHFRDLEDGWKAGGILMVGSPSDKPFDAARDLSMTLLTFLNVPSGERDAWSFSLMYSPTGQLTFPIPGVSYVWNPSDNFSANLGVPFSLHYEPNAKWSIDMRYTPIVNGELIATRQFWNGVSLYGGYRTVSETYLLSDRTNDDERFYFFDQRLFLGIKQPLLKQFELDFSVAYAFDRKLFQSEQFTSNRTDLLNIKPGVAGLLQLSWKR